MDCIKLKDTNNKVNNEKVDSRGILSNISGSFENVVIDYSENNSSSSDDFVPKKKRSGKRSRRQKINLNISNSEGSNAEHSSGKIAVDSKTEEMCDHDQMEIDDENTCSIEKEDPLATSSGVQLDAFFNIYKNSFLKTVT